EDESLKSVPLDDEEEENLQMAVVVPPEEIHRVDRKSPDLHTMGVQFIPKFPRFIFDLAVLLHFLSILISYGLAGSQALLGLVTLPESWSAYLVGPYIIILSVLVIIFSHRMQPFIAAMTFVK